MSGLTLDYDLTRLRGADYNPRKISDEDLAKLRESVTTLGVVKPIIARANGLIVAGHQRTKACAAVGKLTGPVYVLGNDTNLHDEIRFNQLHNGTDLDVGDEEASVADLDHVKGYQVVEASRITGNLRSTGAMVRQEIANLITKYGPWGGVVATFSGTVIHAAQYALAAKLTNTPLTVYAIPDEEEGLYRQFLDRTYGVFNYDSLVRATYIQTLAQMVRLRKGPSGKENKSALYEGHALPYLAAHPDDVSLDFGSGQGDYFNALRQAGRNAYEIEFFRRPGFSKSIDVGAVNRMIDKAIRRLSVDRFDVVVCDSVLNSVDSVEAENSVLTIINAMLKPGGRAFFSGRPLEKRETAMRRTKQSGISGRKRETYFYDENGFSALYREGQWFCQKFHSSTMVRDLCARFGFKIVNHVQGENSWQIEAVKLNEISRLEVIAAVDFEFNLPVSETRRIGRHVDMNAALEPYLC